jgi:phage terminase small subunit
MKQLNAPDGLGEAGKMAWDDGVSYLLETGGFKKIHYMSLYCYSKLSDIIVEGYNQLRPEKSDKTELSVEHENNRHKTNDRKNPIWAVIAEAQREQRAYSAKLGFSPLDESKIPIKAKEEEDELESMLQDAGVSRK